MPAGYPSGTNTFVPNHEASDSLIVGFSRNPKTFPVAEYCQYVRAKNNVGLYMQWTSQEGARILSSDDAEHLWADGEAAREGSDENESWSWQSFTCLRRAYPFTMGQMAVEQASFDIIAAMSGVAAQKAMTARTQLIYNALSTTSWGSNTSAVNNGILASGQDWTTGTTDTLNSSPGPNIKASFQFAEKIIHLATMGVVTPDMLTFVCNPRTAQLMAKSTEIQDLLKHSPYALPLLQGQLPGQNAKWGLPDYLYGHPVRIESAVRNVSNRGNATQTMQYVMPTGEAYFVCRQGDIEGVLGARSFSTVQVFFYKDELTVETKYDADNRRYKGRVVQNMVPLVVSPISGFKFTAATPNS